MERVFHGGGLDAAVAEFGGRKESWLDLSTGINPHGYSTPTLSDDVWTKLPDRLAEAKLEEAARDFYMVPDNFDVIAGPGTQLLIGLLPVNIRAPRVSVISPTYAEHAHVWGNAGAVVKNLVSMGEVDAGTGVLVVVNPNNPDARVTELQELHRVAEALDYLIVDEAFCDVEPHRSIIPSMSKNTVVLRSFGKFFGYAGLRLGFVICNRVLGQKIRRQLGPWAVSGPALAIGQAALRDTNWIANTRETLPQLAQNLASVLAASGCIVEGVNPLFVYVRHTEAAELFHHLALQKILVRQFEELPNSLRIGLCRDDHELKRLKTSLALFQDA